MILKYFNSVFEASKLLKNEFYSGYLFLDNAFSQALPIYTHKIIIAMKWKLAFACMFLLIFSSVAGVNFVQHDSTFSTQNNLENVEKEILWLSEKHPPFKIEDIAYYAGVGIENGKRAIIFNNNGMVEKKYVPIRKNEEYDLLVICPEEFKKALQPLKVHKENHGIKTIIVGLDEIYSGEYFASQGRDDAEKIKYFIKNSVEEWGVKYVLLVGSIYKLPIRNAVYIWKSGYRIVRFVMPTDLYYADLYRYENGNIVFSSWDTNGNGVYGEDYGEGLGQDDIIDLYPDVYVGRIACENKRVVRNVVEKIIEYEDKAYGKEWFKRIILVGGDTFPGWGVVEGELMNELVAQLMNNFQPYRIWYSLGNLNAIEIEKALERGAGFLYYSGHGFPYGWATHAINGSDEEWVGRYFTPYIAALFNGHRLPVIFFDACLTAKLDFNSSDLREDGIPLQINATFPCFAWYFIRHPYGGAIATIGATRVAFTGVDASGPHWGAGYLAYKFFESYQETDILGEVFVNAQEKYLAKNPGDKWTIQEFILLGDPSLKIGGYE
ncbi:MAG: hypothetical protein DRN29_09825 [Thermoplasmata archaeon]|nr:MAG: hypothetical protein DRN29_09825 [Thermoplasmata archaeon]